MQNCANCSKITLHIEQRISHILHLLLSIVTAGIWLIVWFLLAILHNNNPQCSLCGHSKGLINDIVANNTKKNEIKETKTNIKNKEVKWTASNYIIIAIFIAIPLFFFFNMDITYKDESLREKLARQTQDVKNCVNTIGDGVYKNKPLEWKLETCNAKEKTNTRLISNEKISKAHTQYSKRDSGVRSNYLPRVGTTRRDDYRNCIDKEYFIDKVKGVEQDSIDFCRWHAGLGSYSK